MIKLTELARSPSAARRARLAYEDLGLVAHLSELERVDPIASARGVRPFDLLRKALDGLRVWRPLPPAVKFGAAKFGAVKVGAIDRCCG